MAGMSLPAINAIIHVERKNADPCMLPGIALQYNMPQILPPKPYRVDIVEYERGWGSKIDETLYFVTEKEARDHVTEYNKKYNTEKAVPDWYMVAQYIGKVI